MGNVRKSAIVRIIPARAGFTASPRMDTVPSEGSSPLARGLLAVQKVFALGQGIIPARAGFTAVCGPRLALRADHPRSRGVYVCCAPSGRGGWGSSPLARGLPGGGLSARVRLGIIPARAGFTLTATERRALLADHPRSRGVYVAWLVSAVTSVGSSPLARGLQNDSSLASTMCRIIPARAGFTTAPYWHRWHPTGSSPLARGLRASKRRRAPLPRIIPARAGFTYAGTPDIALS